jgi:hypothetical protein
MGIDTRRAHRRPGAVLVIELLFVRPIVAALVLATIEFSMILVARQQLQTVFP